MSINVHEDTYLELLRDILVYGVSSDDRTGVGTTRVFGRMLRFDLAKGFPLLTTKKMEIKSVFSELLWFLEGSGDERRLAEIRYGKPRDELADKKTIWTANAHSPYWVSRGYKSTEGDLGTVYGVMWRAWPNRDGTTTDQIANLIEQIKTDPNGRRHLLTAWNPGELSHMALPPCHIVSQFSVIDGKLSCMLTQRSADALLGIPYNIASYALLTMMIAQVCDLDVGDLIMSFGDCHIYRNHLEQVSEQMIRDPKAAPTVTLDTAVRSIDGFTMDSVSLHNYVSHPPIRAEMAV